MCCDCSLHDAYDHCCSAAAVRQALVICCGSCTIDPKDLEGMLLRWQPLPGRTCSMHKNPAAMTQVKQRC
jgi:hypothetical protein